MSFNVVGENANGVRWFASYLDVVKTHELLTSGSTGTPKTVKLDVDALKAAIKPSTPKVMFFFMYLDHIGGINTVLHAMASGHTLVAVKGRDPDTVCAAIEKYKVQVLPTTPTFLNLLVLSGAHLRHDISSLELITYGTECMPQSTLASIRQHIPYVRLKQTYGLTEIGIVPTKSKSDDSLWMKVAWPTRVIDGVLEIETPKGWFNTGDAVEVDGEWIKIIGRKSDLIIVGGEKIYPAEVENALQTLDGVLSAVVSGEPHPLTGNYVKAKVLLSTDETADEFRLRMRRQLKIAQYKIPVSVSLADGEMVTDRFKKDRHA